MDLTGVALSDAAPLMEGLEQALAQPHVEVVELRDGMADERPIRLSRKKAERVLRELEKTFFATVH